MKTLVLFASLFAILLFGQGFKCLESKEFAFRSAVNAPPPGFPGPVFQLSYDYPTEAPPPCEPTICKWLELDIQFPSSSGSAGASPQWNEGQWNEYIMAILDYVKQGQDASLQDQIGWKTDPGTDQAQWYHVPWMAFDETRGREFIHGLTNERTAHLSDFIGKGSGNAVRGRNTLPLGGQHTKKEFETWAFGVYNEYGGYAIGRSFDAFGQPVMGDYHGAQAPAGLPFPEGTVVAKLLFTTAASADVPYLKDSPVWRANRHVEQNGTYSCERKVQDVRLIQLDVAVVDSRSPTRWVFGTFSYNGNKPGAANVWERLEPVGLQWGSDSHTFPAVPKESSAPAQESVLNTGTGAYEHFGCNGRLAGPVDNKRSSCLSCHAGAFAPPVGYTGSEPGVVPPIFGFPGMCDAFSLSNAEYFSNTIFPQSYAGGQYPDAMNLDTSLQLQVAFLQYGQFNQHGKSAPCEM